MDCILLLLLLLFFMLLCTPLLLFSTLAEFDDVEMFCAFVDPITTGICMVDVADVGTVIEDGSVYMLPLLLLLLSDFDTTNN